MRFARVRRNGQIGLAVKTGEEIRAVFAGASANGLDELLASGADALAEAHRQCAQGEVFAEADLEFLAPFQKASKIICVGLNYHDHATEISFEAPEFPTLFGRFNSSLIGHGAPIVRPRVSEQLDFEGEMVVVIGKPARNVSLAEALDHVAGYSIFNDGSVRDYQMKTPQWTVGKNFDGTGAFGPWFVTADELPRGGKGLKLETRLNGSVVQSASTSDMIFDVATLISLLSSFMTLEVGDIIVSGTPAGVGMGRKPPLWMKDGDVCEIEIEGIGVLRNPVRNEPAS